MLILAFSQGRDMWTWQSKNPHGFSTAENSWSWLHWKLIFFCRNEKILFKYLSILPFIFDLQRVIVLSLAEKVTTCSAFCNIPKPKTCLNVVLSFPMKIYFHMLTLCPLVWFCVWVQEYWSFKNSACSILGKRIIDPSKSGKGRGRNDSQVNYWHPL